MALHRNFRRFGTLAAASSLALLAACSGGSDAAPTGQVVATVNGQEITQAELNAELGGARADSPAGQRQLEQAALQAIVNRYLLADAAEARELTETPAAAITRRKAQQLADISMLERQVTGGVPAVSAEEAQQFVDDNPDSFAQRRIFLVEQIVVPTPPPALLRALEPLDTMAEVQAVLARYNLEGRMTMGVIDALTIDPAAVRQIVGLAPNAVFILPENGAVRINQIRETRVVPVTGQDAVRVARELIGNQRTRVQLEQSIGGILREGQASVQYNPSFRPPAPGARQCCA
ncbi:MAG: hypothetical protein HC774_04700, partial [Sphingomonadales bacterium]|nr:hypothetical protein [Sphingomonadales bacterium]